MEIACGSTRPRVERRDCQSPGSAILRRGHRRLIERGGSSLARHGVALAACLRNRSVAVLLYSVQNHLLRLRRVAPADNLGPLVRLKILVMLEKVLDLLKRDARQIAVVEALVVTHGEVR